MITQDDIEEAVVVARAPPSGVEASRRRSLLLFVHSDLLGGSNGGLNGNSSKSFEDSNNQGSSSSNLQLPMTSQLRGGRDEAPRSTRGGLPLLSNNNVSLAPPVSTISSSTDQPRVLHPLLLKLPLHFRFGCNGLLSNVIFMVVYNWVVSLKALSTIPASTIYSVCYLFYIPLGHATASLLVFGWPDRYIPSLMSNFPIGLTAIAIGGGLTALLDKMEFNEHTEEYIRDNFTFSKMPARSAEDKKSEFYASFLVLIVTSIWTYVLSVYINSQPQKSEKED
jgi:hypothetical protein